MPLSRCPLPTRAAAPRNSRLEIAPVPVASWCSRFSPRLRPAFALAAPAALSRCSLALSCVFSVLPRRPPSFPLPALPLCSSRSVLCPRSSPSPPRSRPPSSLCRARACACALAFFFLLLVPVLSLPSRVRRPASALLSPRVRCVFVLIFFFRLRPSGRPAPAVLRLCARRRRSALSHLSPSLFPFRSCSSFPSLVEKNFETTF